MISNPSSIYLCTVAYLRGGGALCEPPPLWPDRRDFCNILGLFLAPFIDKIAATSDQMRFFWAGKCSKMRLRPGLCPGPRWEVYSAPPALPTCLLLTHVALCRRVRGVIARTRYINVLTFNDFPDNQLIKFRAL